MLAATPRPAVPLSPASRLSLEQALRLLQAEQADDQHQRDTPLTEDRGPSPVDLGLVSLGFPTVKSAGGPLPEMLSSATKAIGRQPGLMAGAGKHLMQGAMAGWLGSDLTGGRPGAGNVNLPWLGTSFNLPAAVAGAGVSKFAPNAMAKAAPALHTGFGGSILGHTADMALTNEDGSPMYPNANLGQIGAAAGLGAGAFAGSKSPIANAPARFLGGIQEGAIKPLTSAYRAGGQALGLLERPAAGAAQQAFNPDRVARWGGAIGMLGTGAGMASNMLDKGNEYLHNKVVAPQIVAGMALANRTAQPYLQQALGSGLDQADQWLDQRGLISEDGRIMPPSPMDYISHLFNNALARRGTDPRTLAGYQKAYRAPVAMAQNWWDALRHPAQISPEESRRQMEEYVAQQITQARANGQQPAMQ